MCDVPFSLTMTTTTNSSSKGIASLLVDFVSAQNRNSPIQQCLNTFLACHCHRCYRTYKYMQIYELRDPSLIKLRIDEFQHFSIPLEYLDNMLKNEHIGALCEHVPEYIQKHARASVEVFIDFLVPIMSNIDKWSKYEHIFFVKGMLPFSLCDIVLELCNHVAELPVHWITLLLDNPELAARMDWNVEESIHEWIACIVRESRLSLAEAMATPCDGLFRRWQNSMPRKNVARILEHVVRKMKLVSFYIYSADYSYFHETLMETCSLELLAELGHMTTGQALWECVKHAHVLGRLKQRHIDLIIQFAGSKHAATWLGGLPHRWSVECLMRCFSIPVQILRDLLEIRGIDMRTETFIIRNGSFYLYADSRMTYEAALDLYEKLGQKALNSIMNWKEVDEILTGLVSDAQHVQILEYMKTRYNVLPNQKRVLYTLGYNGIRWLYANIPPDELVSKGCCILDEHDVEITKFTWEHAIANGGEPKLVIRDDPKSPRFDLGIAGSVTHTMHNEKVLAVFINQTCYESTCNSITTRSSATVDFILSVLGKRLDMHRVLDHTLYTYQYLYSGQKLFEPWLADYPHKTTDCAFFEEGRVLGVIGVDRRQIDRIYMLREECKKRGKIHVCNYGCNHSQCEHMQCPFDRILFATFLNAMSYGDLNTIEHMNKLSPAEFSVLKIVRSVRPSQRISDIVILHMAKMYPRCAPSWCLRIYARPVREFLSSEAEAEWNRWQERTTMFSWQGLANKLEDFCTIVFRHMRTFKVLSE